MFLCFCYLRKSLFYLQQEQVFSLDMTLVLICFDWRFLPPVWFKWGCLVIGRFESRLPKAACRSVLEQDTEPQIAPDEQLVPCMAASGISV